MITKQQQPYPHKDNDSKQQPQQIHENNQQEEQNRNCYDCIKGVYCYKWWQSIKTSTKRIQSIQSQKHSGSIKNYHNNKISITKTVSDNKLTIGRLTTQESNDIKNVYEDKNDYKIADKNDYKNDYKNNDKDKQPYISNNNQNIDKNNYGINTYNNKNTHNIYQQQQRFDNHNNSHTYSSYKGKTKQLIGIRNLGNTCYMNATLQCLLNLEEFNSDLQDFMQKLEYFLKIRQSKETQQCYYLKQQQQSVQFKGSTNITREYLNILQKCYQQQFYTKTLNTSDLREAIIQATRQKGHYNNKFHLYRQQDAHQFLTCLLDMMNKQLQQQLLLEKSSSPSSLIPSSLLLETKTKRIKQQQQHKETMINKYFQLSTLSVIECKSCASKQSVVDKSLGLTVDVNIVDVNVNVNVDVDVDVNVDNNNQSNQPYQYTNKFNSGQQYHESRHHHHQIYQQQYQPQYFPSVQQLVQNQWNPNNKCTQIQNYYCPNCNQQTTIKNTQSLYRLPKVVIIQLKRFLQNSYNNIVEKDTSIVNVSQYLDFTHLISGESDRQNNKNDKNNKSNNKFIYKLSSIVNHYGSTKSGHYTAHVHKQNLNQWYIVNDSIVDKIKFQTLSQSAYLLFYQKIQ